jgi:hypothetical protein
MRQNAGLLTQHVSSIIMPIFRSTLGRGHFLHAAYTTNSPAIHDPDGLQVGHQKAVLTIVLLKMDILMLETC